MKIYAIKAFEDNYIWAIVRGHQAIIVDPGDAAVVMDFLEQRNLTLDSILITHKHFDHIGGVAALKSQTNCAVYGPRNKEIKDLTRELEANNEVVCLGFSFRIIDMPGHTLEHIGFYCQKEALFFVGDTLFAGGCGRMFEGTYDMFNQTLEKIAQYPPETKIYCTHEYTEANLRFALAVEPTNSVIKERLNSVHSLRQHDKITLPTTIEQEVLTNPFLRTQKSGVIQAALSRDAPSSSPVHVFAALRQWKDTFNG